MWIEIERVKDGDPIRPDERCEILEGTPASYPVLIWRIWLWSRAGALPLILLEGTYLGAVRWVSSYLQRLKS